MEFKSKKHRGKELWDIIHPSGHVIATVKTPPTKESLETASEDLKTACEVQR